MRVSNGWCKPDHNLRIAPYIPSNLIFSASRTPFTNLANTIAPESSSLGNKTVLFFIEATRDLAQSSALRLSSSSTVCTYMHAPYPFNNASQKACKLIRIALMSAMTARNLNCGYFLQIPRMLVPRLLKVRR